MWQYFIRRIFGGRVYFHYIVNILSLTSASLQERTLLKLMKELLKLLKLINIRELSFYYASSGSWKIVTE